MHRWAALPTSVARPVCRRLIRKRRHLSGRALTPTGSFLAWCRTHGPGQERASAKVGISAVQFRADLSEFRHRADATAHCLLVWPSSCKAHAIAGSSRVAVKGVSLQLAHRSASAPQGQSGLAGALALLGDLADVRVQGVAFVPVLPLVQGVHRVGCRAGYQPRAGCRSRPRFRRSRCARRCGRAG